MVKEQKCRSRTRRVDQLKRLLETGQQGGCGGDKHGCSLTSPTPSRRSKARFRRTYVWRSVDAALKFTTVDTSATQRRVDVDVRRWSSTYLIKKCRDERLSSLRKKKKMITYFLFNFIGMFLFLFYLSVMQLKTVGNQKKRSELLNWEHMA